MKSFSLALLVLCAVSLANSAPHGGQIYEAEVVAKGNDSVEKFFIEAVNQGDKLTLYPYVVVPKQEGTYLPVAPLVELKKVIVRLGSDLINTQTTLVSVSTKTAIETRIGRHDSRLDTVILTMEYKGGTREARFPLKRAE